MNHLSIVDQISVIFLSIAVLVMITIPILILCDTAYATNVNEGTSPKADDLWNVDPDRDTTKRVMAYLKNNYWASPSIDDEELDYIVTLVFQLSPMFKHLKPELILAMIAVESGFNRHGEYLGARGLMQLLPMYHSERLIQYIGEDERYDRSLFYDARLNIMTGCDYMNYILGETNDDVDFALMWYNQGAVEASTDYEHHDIVSEYAKKIHSLSDKLARIIHT